jgi:hypothetical protein
MNLPFKGIVVTVRNTRFKGNDNLEDLVTNGRTILKRISKKMTWTRYIRRRKLVRYRLV